jgi:very-short-patch-repair endonuclease
VRERVHNIEPLKENRRKLRRNLTPAEARLWSFLQGSLLEGRKFRRQHSVGPYILDFYCPAERLCIELDGNAHFSERAYEYDTTRTEYLRSVGITVLRFENRNVFENTEGVLEEIRKNFVTNHPSLTKEGS